MIWLRSLFFQFAFYGWSLVLGLVALPLLLAPPATVMRFGRFWSRIGLALLRLCVGLDHEIRGREHLPAGPALIAMKHQSAWDTLAAPVVFGDPAIVIKRELGWIPLYGWFALKAGMIPIDRGGGAATIRGMIAGCRAAAAQGRSILIFPEGTRSAVGARLPYQPGIAALYRQLDLPLVPVAVNSGVFWGRRRFAKRPGRIVLEILPAIPPGLDRRAVMAELESRIEIATDRLVAAAQAPDQPGDRFVDGAPPQPGGSRV